MPDKITWKRMHLHYQRLTVLPEQQTDIGIFIGLFHFKVLTSFRDALDHVVVENFVVDFEQAAWLAVRQVFPTVTIKGCVFHLTTAAIFKYAARLGLKPRYMERGSVHNYIRSLLALPFLPAQHIEPAFVELASRANSPATKELCSYINDQWMNHLVFDIPSWSVFGLTVRTNNDVEGWHNRLNSACAGHTLSFYRLVPALRSEAECVGYEVAHVRQGVSTRRIRPVSKTIENKIQNVLEEYSAKNIETGDLLKECGKIYGPQVE
ncbi:uncharacterized protein LOC123558320 [Mercenaria mercenaria]|uniref:uncharacterized protein LOC123558320 n=1 Tax=Mercenaria mercenaria TaxID=6596 RepID=UPI00234E9FE1|nr:uncharacterized protein LOC123558320 [Mercenaria mercenaria]